MPHHHCAASSLCCRRTVPHHHNAVPCHRHHLIAIVGLRRAMPSKRFICSRNNP
ncbi:uncharacterized protein J3R85_007705 [Psidium guajava]|nr:uncharacterized protein J3R85_007705 [Psidium guajava]